MGKIGILTMFILLIGLFACNEKNERKSNGDFQDNPETLDTGREENTPATNDQTDSYPEDTWGNYYDRSMDISSMYKDLDMTEQQITDYESSTKRHRDKLNNSGKTFTNEQAILMHRDSSLQSALTPDQYKKFKEIAEKRKDNVN